jgi:hypothetical protein
VRRGFETVPEERSFDVDADTQRLEVRLRRAGIAAE